MKKFISFLQHQTAALTGKMILAIYHLYTRTFMRKKVLELPHPTLQQREIILVRKTGQVYSAIADVLALN